MNDIKEVDNLRKTLGKVKIVYLIINKEDIDYLKKELSKIYNISYDNQVILSLRDLVDITTYELTKDINPYKPKTLIENILDEISKEYDKKNILKKLISKVYEHRIVTDVDLLVDIAVKVLGYSPLTAKRYVREILKDVW